MNLTHEYDKIVSAFNNRTITEDKLRYELLKLECVAKVLNKEWKFPLRSNIGIHSYIKPVLAGVMKEDYDELNKLYESGILNEDRYNRDCKKIMTMCSIAGIEYPGDNSPGIDMIVESMDEYDGDEYAGMDEDDEFEEEETSEPQLDGILQFDDGTSISRWIVGSEFEWQCDETPTANYHGSLEGVEKIIYKNIDKLGGLQAMIDDLEDEIHKQEDINQDLKIINNHNHYMITYIRDLYKLKELLISNQYMKYINSGRTLHASLFELAQNTIDMLMTGRE